MDAQIKSHSCLVQIAIITFTVLLLCMNPAYSHGGHGGGHHGGYHHGGYHHGGYYNRGYYNSGYRRGWGGTYYYGSTNVLRSCIWVPAHYNRYNLYVPGHRAC